MQIGGRRVALAITVLVMLPACAPGRLHTYGYGQHARQYDDSPIPDEEYHVLDFGLAPDAFQGIYGCSLASGDNESLVRVWAAYDVGFFFPNVACTRPFGEQFRLWPVCRPRAGVVYGTEDAGSLRLFVGGGRGLTLHLGVWRDDPPTAFLSIEYVAIAESGGARTAGWMLRFYRTIN